jgi:hypothetical protein
MGFLMPLIEYTPRTIRQIAVERRIESNPSAGLAAARPYPQSARAMGRPCAAVSRGRCDEKPSKFEAHPGEGRGWHPFPSSRDQMIGECFPTWPGFAGYRRS